MTLEAMTELVGRMRTDEVFRGHVLAAEAGEDRLAYVNGEGFDVTAQELVDVTSQLTDGDLEGLAGGASSPGQNQVAEGGAPELGTIFW